MRWKNDLPHTILKNIFLFSFGGALYYLIECLYRGHSHVSMQILGGIVFMFAGWQNEWIDWDVGFIYQLASVEMFALVSEFITGCVVNLWLKLDVWDYSNLPGNILGQTSWQFALLFLPLCGVAIVLDDFIRWVIFGEEKPTYKFW